MMASESTLMAMDMRDRRASLAFAAFIVLWVVVQHVGWQNVNGLAATVGLAVAGFTVAYALLAGRIYRRNVLRQRR